MQSPKQYLKILYLSNLALLITHEIDSAFWHEWQILHLPGGIQFFLILNLMLVIIFLLGFEQVLLWKMHATKFSWLLALAGLFAVCIHLWFILTGHQEFLLPVSLIILGLTGVISILQITALILLRKRSAQKEIII